ncbi:uncharacterized protein [Periplaneta americana]|uniref:uncharacterized protein isoform X5 n=1 Tax=Periplaneta americana TaxID=6978 RepID=UPI0037E7CF69
MSDLVKRSYSYCFNPFKVPKHRKRGKILMRVTSAMLVKLKMQDINLSSDLKVCKSCSVKISKLPKEQSASELCAPVVMVVIKMEPDIDPLASYKTDTEEGNSLSQEGNIFGLYTTEIKAECMDHSYDVKSEITFEETSVEIDSSIVKSETEEEVRELNKLEEVKLEVTAEEDEVLTDRK